MAIRRSLNDECWLSNNSNNGLLTDHQFMLYVAPKGLGEVKPQTATGRTPNEAFSDRYAGAASALESDYIGQIGIIVDADRGKKSGNDNTLRAEIERRHYKGLIPFSAYHHQYPAPDGVNEEALINFVPERDMATLIGIAKEVFGYSPKTDTRRPWIPRDCGTPAGQDLMVAELVDKVISHKRAAFAGYTGVGKSHIGVATAHQLKPTGGLVLITTPIVDTAQSFEDNIEDYRYGQNREMPVSLYRQDIIEPGALLQLRQRADSGELIFLLLTVQDVRYKDEPGAEGIRAKYEDLENIKVDVWIRDEFHKEYGGAETSKTVAKIEEQTACLIDLSATLRNAIEQGTYHLNQIVNRNFFWALENRQYMAVDPVPELMIMLLGDIQHDRLPADIQEMYDPAEGWSHGKLTETVNGRPKQYAGFKGMLVRAYTLEDDFDANPWTINNHPALCPLSKGVGLWRFPHGDQTMSAQDLYVPLAKQLRQEKEFERAGVYITSSWEISESLKPRQTVGEYVEELRSNYNHVVILTQTKYCTGSDIPSLGHEVLCDNISSPITMEQFFPGRVFRRYPGKTNVALFVIAPGNTLIDNFNAMAADAKRGDPTRPMTDYLRQIQISKYAVTWSVITAEEMFADFQSKLIQKIRAEISTRELEAIIKGEDLAQFLGGLDFVNKPESKSKKLTEENNSKDKKTDIHDEEDEAEDSPEESTSSSADPVRVAAQSINAVMVEVPAFAVPENIVNIRQAIGHKMIRLMFDSKSIDKVLLAMDQCPALHQRLQDKLTEWHNANQNLPYEEIIDQVYKNTERKKKIGLVFIKKDLAEELVRVTAD